MLSSGAIWIGLAGHGHLVQIATPAPIVGTATQPTTAKLDSVQLSPAIDSAVAPALLGGAAGGGELFLQILVLGMGGDCLWETGCIGLSTGCLSTGCTGSAPKTGCNGSTPPPFLWFSGNSGPLKSLRMGSDQSLATVPAPVSSEPPECTVVTSPQVTGRSPTADTLLKHGALVGAGVGDFMRQTRRVLLRRRRGDLVEESIDGESDVVVTSWPSSSPSSLSLSADHGDGEKKRLRSTGAS